ncbi:ParB/RepB/Spo0J family partition protein [uncultured Nostoc sp.]|uniref:ParB/RepB/Spo0J family partition protein n=1 Tax=uncultured Nostoc sp. TaxID=340711 RepID=UPI0035CAB845
MANIQIKERKIVELHPHPKNEGIYGDEDIEQLAQDIERSKWVKPLIVTPEGTIISGHRRWKAVSYLGWVTVPIEEKEFTDEIAELEALLLENANREKSIEQKCREGLTWEAIERNNSRQRQGSKGSGVGSTRDVIAKRVGIGSGINYEKARKVVLAIDEALLVGNLAKAEALRKKLNHKSVNAAFKMISSIENTNETQQHTQMQWILAKLGQKLCGSVWIASNDRSRMWEKEQLGNLSIDSFPPLGIGNDAQSTVKYIDVVWLSGSHQITAAFEVELTTPIYSGLLRMADLVTLCPNLNFPLYIVVPESRTNKVKKELTRATFKNLKLDKKCRYIVIEKLMEKWDAIMEIGTSVDTIKRISHSFESDS